jgi:DNA gyrase subunit A
VEHFSLANSKDTVLFFTSRGRVFSSPAYEIPQASRTSRGRAIVNFIALSKGETIAAMVAVPKRSGVRGMWFW